MALTSYEQVKGFSPMIREVIRTKRMPPYGADPDVGHFKDDKRLSADQIRTLVHWIEAGSPRGAGADPLQKVAFSVPEWPLGKPDLVVDAPAYDIPASGIVDYQRPYVPNPMKEGRWLKASTIKVANRQAVHHVLSGQITPEDAPGKDAPQKVSEGAWGLVDRHLRRGLRVGDRAGRLRHLADARRRLRAAEPLHPVRQGGDREEPDRALFLQEG